MGKLELSAFDEVRTKIVSRDDGAILQLRAEGYAGELEEQTCVRLFEAVDQIWPYPIQHNLSPRISANPSSNDQTRSILSGSKGHASARS